MHKCVLAMFPLRQDQHLDGLSNPIARHADAESTGWQRAGLSNMHFTVTVPLVGGLAWWFVH